METEIEKVTLSLNRMLLEKMAKRARKTRSAFVRDLIEREANLLEDQLLVSPEILDLKGSLDPTTDNTKKRVHRAVRTKLRSRGD